MEAEATQDDAPAPAAALPVRPGPGTLVRLLSGVLPGVRNVAGHIARHGAVWDERSTRALAGDAPLWFALGDSTAQGIGAELVEESYVARLHAARPVPLRDVEVVNVSVSGARVRDVLREQIPILHAHRARVALVTCSIGSNDLLRAPDARRTNTALRDLMDALDGLPVVALATLPVGTVSIAGRLVNRMIRTEAPRRGFAVADVAARYRPPLRGKVATDRFHPNGDGYADWAAAFVEALDW